MFRTRNVRSAAFGAVVLGAAFTALPIVVPPLAGPAAAQTPAAANGTVAFAARATIYANALEAGGRLALERSTVARVQDFARGGVRDDVRYANAISTWANSPAAATQVPPDPKGPVHAMLAGGLGAEGAKLVPAPTGQPVRAADAEALKQMQSLSSPDFDKRFIEIQQALTRDALAIAEAYGRSGEDRVLRRAARNEIPSLRARLAILERRV